MILFFVRHFQFPDLVLARSNGRTLPNPEPRPTRTLYDALVRCPISTDPLSPGGFCPLLQQMVFLVDVFNYFKTLSEPHGFCIYSIWQEEIVFGASAAYVFLAAKAPDVACRSSFGDDEAHFERGVFIIISIAVAAAISAV